MKASDLLEKHPLTTIKIREFFLNKMLESFNTEEVPEEFKQDMINRGVNDEHIAKLIDIQPRMFFDLFDSIEKVIIINHEEEQGFSWSVGMEKSKESFSSRVEAERSAIVRVFEMLEPTNEISEN